MRTLTFVVCSLGFALAACGKDTMLDTGDDDPTSGDDAGSGSSTDDGGIIDPPARGFQIVSPPITIEPGQEITYCYYFRTPNTEEMVIKKWESAMTPGSHHMIYYSTGTNDVMPPGTVSDADCGNFGANNLPNWTYAAQTVENSVTMPQDDGTGKPLGQVIKPNTAGYFQMHYLNAGDSPLDASVTLNAEAYDAGVAFTRTEPFITYNANISVGPGEMNKTVTATAPVTAGKKFWMMSTHAHKQATNTTVRDGSEVMFTSDDWEHPEVKEWMADPFYTFTSNSLTWSCTYSNIGTNSGRTVTDGSSANTDEMCMATGFYFPANKPITCLHHSFIGNTPRTDCI